MYRSLLLNSPHKRQFLRNVTNVLIKKPPVYLSGGKNRIMDIYTLITAKRDEIFLRAASFNIPILVNKSIQKCMSAELIRVNEKTKDRLKSLKEHPRETYCDVIERLISMTVDDEPLFAETLAGIEEGLEDLEAGRVRPLREIAKEMGI